MDKEDPKQVAQAITQPFIFDAIMKRMRVPHAKRPMFKRDLRKFMKQAYIICSQNDPACSCLKNGADTKIIKYLTHFSKMAIHEIYDKDEAVPNNQKGGMLGPMIAGLWVVVVILAGFADMASFNDAS